MIYKYMNLGLISLRGPRLFFVFGVKKASLRYFAVYNHLFLVCNISMMCKFIQNQNSDGLSLQSLCSVLSTENIVSTRDCSKNLPNIQFVLAICSFIRPPSRAPRNRALLGDWLWHVPHAQGQSVQRALDSDVFCCTMICYLARQKGLGRKKVLP